MGRTLFTPSAPLELVKPQAANGPGSNGYWRRDVFDVPGTFTWTAEKAGKIKIQALGAAAGANGSIPGASAGFGEKSLFVTAGQSLTVVVGQGGVGASPESSTVPSGSGTSTSVSGTPVGGTPLVLTGASGTTSQIGANTGAMNVAGGFSGPWDKTFGGAASAIAGVGSPSSGSPFGPGRAAGSTVGSGGSGWGGAANGFGGASSHNPSFGQEGRGAPSLTESSAFILGAGGSGLANIGSLSALPFWDFSSVDSAGGSAIGGASASYYCLDAGPGAGGGGNPGSGGGMGGRSTLGGGTGRSYATGAPPSGYGAGGGISAGAGNAGKGGDGFVMIFWDEGVR